jgi:transposase
MQKRAQKQRFATIMAELERLRDWLKQDGVTHVVMESTASCWKPVFNVLEADFHVYLANPQEVKNRKGHKTDDKDGLVVGSPPAPCHDSSQLHPTPSDPRVARPDPATQAAAEQWDRGEESDSENIRGRQRETGNVLSDVFGVSGQLMLEALLKGKAEPAEIAQFAKRRAQRRIPEIIQALGGHRMSDHHRQMIRYSLKHLEFVEEQVGDLDLAIAKKIKTVGLQQQ